MRKLSLIAFLFALSAPAFAAHTVTLTWTQSIDPIALNCIARSATSGAEDFTKPLFCSTSPIVQYVDNVALGDTWFYQVDAVDAKGHASKGSNETPPQTVSPLPPQNLQAVTN